MGAGNGHTHTQHSPCGHCTLGHGMAIADIQRVAPGNLRRVVLQVSWLTAAGTLDVHPIHVTVESRVTGDILFKSLSRQMQYWKSLNDYLLECGIIDKDRTFTLECIGAMFSDKGSPLGRMRGLVSQHSKRAILHFYELMHRVYNVEEAVCECLYPGVKAFHGTVYQLLKTCYLFVSGNKPLYGWLRVNYGVAKIRWVTRVTYGRFSTFGAAAWVLVNPVSSGARTVWEILQIYMNECPDSVTSQRYSTLVQQLQDEKLWHQARALCILYLKFDLPFSRRAAQHICYADVKQFLQLTVTALRSRSESVGQGFLGPDNTDIYGQPIVPPSLRRHGSRNTADCRAIARLRLSLGCQTHSKCTICDEGTAGGSMLQCDKCAKWYHTTCCAAMSIDFGGESWYCSSCESTLLAPRRSDGYPVCGSTDDDVAAPSIGLPTQLSPLVPYEKLLATLVKHVNLEADRWGKPDDNVTAWMSLNCPFTADATEGPIGVLKSVMPGALQRTECMLRAILLARRYDKADSTLKLDLPLESHLPFLKTMASVVLRNNAQCVRDAERIALVTEIRDAKCKKAAKRARVADVSSFTEKCTMSSDIRLLSVTHGAKPALLRQADYFGVSRTGSRGDIASRILELLAHDEVSDED